MEKNVEQKLPVDDAAEMLVKELAAGRQVVLKAPTGTGKSTRVPVLLDQAADKVFPSDSRRILVLEPRRLAARMLARRVADEMGVELGREVGFITRYERCFSERQTRIAFITAGIFPRMFSSGSDLPGVGAVLIDEFHERSVMNDLALGAAVSALKSCRPDLRLMVMSATLDGDSLVNYLPDAALVEVESRLYPVEITYSAPSADENIWDAAAKVLRGMLTDGISGDALVFMPGVYEINRCVDSLRRRSGSEKLTVLPLYGNLPPKFQDEVMGPSEHRKVIVATNIAETSLTIPGVRHVIDSGLARISRYDHSKGVSGLDLERISRHSADQRAGRAGREAPGRCIRLWSQGAHNRLPESSPPEISRADLAEVVLPVMAMGFEEPAKFPWLDAPKTDALLKAKEVLRLLGALDGEGRLTALGRRLSEFPAHPRIARLLLAAEERRDMASGALAAAIISERSIVAGRRGVFRELARRYGLDGASGGQLVSDFEVLFEVAREVRGKKFDGAARESIGVNAAAVRSVWRAAERYAKMVGGEMDSEPSFSPELSDCLLLAFPDHLVRRTDFGSSVCLGRDGSGELSRDTICRRGELLLPMVFWRGSNSDGVELSLVTEIDADRLSYLFTDDWFDETEDRRWNSRKRLVERFRSRKFIGVVIDSSTASAAGDDGCGGILAEKVLDGELKISSWDERIEHFLQRVRWVAEAFERDDLPDYDYEDIACVVSEFCEGEYSWKGIKNKEILPYFENAMPWKDLEFIRKMAPERIELPCGRRMRIKYEPGRRPRGVARIQELYGLEDSPRIGGGRFPLLIEILAPNMRAVQLTDDLAGFWRELYPKVKKELSRRYPKHEWR